jgi:hypothetical protein
MPVRYQSLCVSRAEAMSTPVAHEKKAGRVVAPLHGQRGERIATLAGAVWADFCQFGVRAARDSS